MPSPRNHRIMRLSMVHMLKAQHKHSSDFKIVMPTMSSFMFFVTFRAVCGQQLCTFLRYIRFHDFLDAKYQVFCPTYD